MPSRRAGADGGRKPSVNALAGIPGPHLTLRPRFFLPASMPATEPVHGSYCCSKLNLLHELRAANLKIRVRLRS